MLGRPLNYGVWPPPPVGTSMPPLMSVGNRLPMAVCAGGNKVPVRAGEPYDPDATALPVDGADEQATSSWCPGWRARGASGVYPPPAGSIGLDEIDLLLAVPSERSRVCQELAGGRPVGTAFFPLRGSCEPCEVGAVGSDGEQVRPILDCAWIRLVQDGEGDGVAIGGPRGSRWDGTKSVPDVQLPCRVRAQRVHHQVLVTHAGETDEHDPLAARGPSRVRIIGESGRGTSRCL